MTDLCKLRRRCTFWCRVPPLHTILQGRQRTKAEAKRIVSFVPTLRYQKPKAAYEGRSRVWRKVGDILVQAHMTTRTYQILCKVQAPLAPSRACLQQNQTASVATTPPSMRTNYSRHSLTYATLSGIKGATNFIGRASTPSSTYHVRLKYTCSHWKTCTLTSDKGAASMRVGVSKHKTTPSCEQI